LVIAASHFAISASKSTFATSGVGGILPAFDVLEPLLTLDFGIEDYAFKGTFFFGNCCQAKLDLKQDAIH
jgi:hypothetical protein